jgi:hypothetical protein
MTALRLRVGRLVASEEDEAASARRSWRDWIVDSALFLLATMAGGATLGGNVEKGLGGTLLAADAAGGAALCLALWGRRRWPVGLGLASVPILAFSSFAGPANGIILFTVAAYRRWQLAFLVAGLQLAVAPAYHALHPEDDWLSPGASYLVSILGTAAVVGWGMFWRGTNACAALRPSNTAHRPNSSCASSRSATPSAPGSRARCTTCSPTGSRC